MICKFNFVLQASHAVVLSNWRRNAWRTPETSAWETNLVLINWISCYIFKGLFLQHSVQQTTMTNHDQHSNQHWRICRRILVYIFCLINIGLSLSDEYESRGGSSDFRLQTSHFGLKTSFFKLQTSDLSKFELRISDFWPLRLNAAWLDFWPPTSHFLLSTSHFWLPTSHFPIPISHFQLPTSHF